MSYQCPLFIPIPDANRPNCGNCMKWKDQKCEDEEKLIGLI